jgi:hypothetical protein
MRLQLARPIVELGEVSQFRVRVDLETPAVRVVHQDEGGTVVGVDIADADALPVAPEVRAAGCLVVEHLEESGSPLRCGQPLSLYSKGKNESGFSQ